MKQEISMQKSQLKNPDIPNEYKSGLREEMALNQYRLANNIAPIYADSLAGFMKSTIGYTSLITLFIIIIASSIVSQEYTWGTMKFNLMRPVSKWKLLSAKFVSIVLNTLVFLSILIVFSFICGVIAFGISDLSARYLYYHNQDIKNISITMYLLRYIIIKIVGIIVIAAFAFTVSTVFKNNVLSMVLSIFIQFSGTLTGNTLALLDKDLAKFIFFTNTDLYQYIEGTAPPGMSLSFSIFVLAVYLFLFFIVAIFVFYRRESIS